MMLGQTVKARCRKCGNEAPASEFKMHYDFRMMVCPLCFKGEGKTLSNQPKEDPKSPGWDKEDEYLEKQAKFRQKESNIAFRRIPGSNYLMCACVRCNYKFKYDPVKEMPKNCPYCNHPLPHLKNFSFYKF